MSFSPHPPGLSGCSSIQEQRDRWERKRSRAAKELVQTEEHYCQQLELVTTFFVEILKAKGTLKEDVREGIFSSIKSILSMNQSLLVHLENGYIGKGLEKFSSHLHHYNTYVDNIYNANKLLGIQLKKNKAFRRFKKLQEARPQFNSQKLEDMLQMPVQRIRQYKHLLQDLAANTSPDHPEFEQLSRALVAVCEVSQRIQGNAQRHENHLQLCRVQKLLQGRKTRVLAPGRWFIREGWLNMVPPKGSEAKPKMFFLFSDLLLEARRCSPLSLSNGEKFVGQHAYPLQDAAVEKVFGHTRSQGGLLSLTLPNAKLLLMSSNHDDLNDWYQCLSSAIRKLQSKHTVVLQRDERCGQPLHPAVDHSNPGRKRDLCHTKSRLCLQASVEPSEHAQKSVGELECSAPKRTKQSVDAEPSSAEASSSSCVIL
uniref:Rho guanine nucleotide exchange factor (GEF) 39 n=1 Tax=Poecilia formosa TaxID=48698 RepID=A0A096MIB6_POEFO